MPLFCRAWMAFVSFRKVRGLTVFLPFLKFMIADLATPDWRQRRSQAKHFSNNPNVILRTLDFGVCERREKSLFTQEVVHHLV